MTSCRTIEIRAPLRALLIASGLSAGLSLAAAAETPALGEGMLSPTPLILKDGRIANVSVHVVAFAQDQAALGPEIARQLGVLTGEVATDCFLTAQVIGHVGASEVAGNDTLSAHRLARARADAVQASLIGGGLPAKAIASVWDWQFLVREARATLWVFRLTPGEDCDGAPLESAPSALVAHAEPQAPVPRGAPPPATAVPGEAPRQAAPPPTVARPAIAEAAPAPLAAVPAGPSPAPARAPSVTQALPAASPAASLAEARPPNRSAEPRAAQSGPAATTAAQAAPAESRRAAGAPVAEVVAALPERPSRPAPAAARAEPAQRQAAVEGREEQLVIVFPTNSSYFPPGTAAQLRSLLRNLAADRRYEVVLRSSVSGSQQVVGAESAEEAARYNQWLAERRLERVRDWLGQHAAGGGLTIKPEYHADDDSRQVVIRIRPVG